MRITFRQIFSLIVSILLGIYIVTAMGYNPQARLMPLVVSIPIFLLSIWQTLHDFRMAVRRTGMDQEERPAGESTSAPQEKLFKKELSVSLWVISVFVSFTLFGFILTTSLYTFLSLKARSRMGWKPSLGVSIGCLAFLYVVMIFGLRVDLYPGRLILIARKALYGY
jgi:predicted secreted protein